LFGYHGSALLPAQVLNLIEGAFTLGLISVLLMELTGDRRLTVLLCAAVGWTYSFWSNAAMVSDHMASCLLAVILFRMLLREPVTQSRSARVAGLGFVNGLAMLMHQTNCLLGVMFLTALFSEIASPTTKARALFIYASAGAATVAIPYLAVGIFILGNTTLYDFTFWCFYYAMPGVIDVSGNYGGLKFEKIAELFSGFGASVVGGFYWMNRIFEIRPLQRNGVPVLSALAGVMPVFIAIRAMAIQSVRGYAHSTGKAQRLALSWFLAYAVLLFWWAPWYYQMWSVPLIGLFFYLGSALHEKLRRPLAECPSVQFALTAFAVLLLSANSIAAFLPSRDISNNDYYTTTIEIGKKTNAGDMIVIPGNDEYDTYIPYFIKREVVSLHALLIDHLNDLEGSLETIGEKISETGSAGHDVFIVSELRDTARTYADLYKLHHVDPEVLARFFRQYPVEDAVATGSLTLYKLGGIRPDQPSRLTASE
ncbi:MAG TPA: hypothetical protein VGR15_07995, partial [Bacteroidota bacterium]|nr:hypothetical protein [Bacteroidota bacterium]